MAKLLTEFVGTLFLTLTIGLAVLSGSDLAPIAIGAVLTALVYMGGHISGAHYNPAVSLAVYMRRRITGPWALAYVSVQFAAAGAAGVLAWLITGDVFALTPAHQSTLVAAILVEVLFTFMLALVILNVAFSGRTAGNQYYGLAIGLTIMGAAFVGGDISGGVFNPAVGLGPIVVASMLGSATVAHAWLYLVAPCTGAALAALVFGLQDRT